MEWKKLIEHVQSKQSCQSFRSQQDSPDLEAFVPRPTRRAVVTMTCSDHVIID